MSEIISRSEAVPAAPVSVSVSCGEGYPSGWLHAIIHLNPQTGELHSDGDHSVRSWLQGHMLTKEQAEIADAGLFLAESELRGSARRWRRKKNTVMAEGCIQQADKIAAVRAALAKASGSPSPERTGEQNG